MTTCQVKSRTSHGGVGEDFLFMSDPSIFIVLSSGHVWLILLFLLSLKEVRIQRQPWDTPTGLNSFSLSPEQPQPHYLTWPHQDSDFSCKISSDVFSN